MGEKKIQPKRPEGEEPAAGTREADEDERPALEHAALEHAALEHAAVPRLAVLTHQLVYEGPGRWPGPLRLIRAG